jgi:hypothetical protein
MYLEAGTRRLRRRPAVAAGRHDSFLRLVLEDCPIAASAALMRRAVWEQGEQEYPLDAAAVGDKTMWIRAALAGWPFHYLDEPLVAYSMHPEQLSWRPGIATRPVKVYERFSFDDPECERLRRARLAEARLALASAHLWRGQIRNARLEIGRAREAAPGPLGIRGWLAVTGLRPRVAKLAATNPRVLLAAIRGWSALRPAVARDSKGRSTIAQPRMRSNRSA